MAAAGDMKESIRRLSRQHGARVVVEAGKLLLMRKKIAKLLASAFPGAYVRVLTAKGGLKILVLDDSFSGMDTYKRVSAIMKPVRLAAERGELTDTQVGLIISVDAFAPMELV